MCLSIPALKHCRRVFVLNIEHTEVSGTTGTLQTSQKLISGGISAQQPPHPTPAPGISGEGKAAQPLCWTLENPRGVAHTSNRGLMFCCGVRWLLDHGWGISLLKSLTESRGRMRELLGRGSGGFSNPLLPSAARALPGSQKRGWKTFPEPISLLSQPGRCPCLSLPAGRVCADKNVDAHS